MRVIIEMTESERQLRNGHLSKSNPIMQWVDKDCWVRREALTKENVNQFNGIIRLCFQVLRLVVGIVYKLDREHRNFHKRNHT